LLGAGYGILQHWLVDGDALHKMPGDYKGMADKRSLIGWDMAPFMVAGAMLAWSWLHPLPKIYRDCIRLGSHVHIGMLPVSETERFCIDNKGVIHFPGRWARII
jgi:hypothetical protein